MMGMYVRGRCFWVGALVVLCLCAAGWAETQALTLLHINDTHGRLRDSGAEGGPVGGMARLSTLVKEARAEDPELLFLHAGDLLSRGDVLTSHSGGAVNFKLMSRLGYDAYTPGNGEWYWGPHNLLAQSVHAKFPILHANTVDKATGKSLFQPYCFIERNGITIGILGLGLTRMNRPYTESLAYLDPIEVTQTYVPILRAEADLVIILSHLGNEADITLGTTVPGIDLILGSHTHSNLPKPMRLSALSSDREAIYVRAGDYGRHLGRFDLTVAVDEAGGRIADFTWQLIPIDSDVPEDPEVVAFLDSFDQELAAVVGNAKVTIPHVKKGFSPMGNLVAEAVRQVTGADLAFLDNDTVHNGIEAGAITRADILSVHDGRDGVVLAELNGAQIWQALEEAELHYAGCTVTRTENGTVSAVLVDGIALDPAQTYSTALSIWVPWDVEALQGIASQPTGERVDTALTKFLQQYRSLKPKHLPASLASECVMP